MQQSELQIGPAYLMASGLLLFGTAALSLFVYDVDPVLAVRNGLIALVVFQLLILVLPDLQRLALRADDGLNKNTRNMLTYSVIGNVIVSALLTFAL